MCKNKLSRSLNAELSHKDLQFDDANTVFYKRFSGMIFGIFGALIGGISILIGYLLYQSIDNSYSIFTNLISELSLGNFGTKLSFSIGLSFGTFLISFFYLSEMKTLSKKIQYRYHNFIIKIGFFLYLMGGGLAGLFLVNHPIHIFAAVFYFVGSLFYHVILGYYTFADTIISKFHGMLSYFIVCLNSLFLLTEMSFTLNISPLIIISAPFMEWFIYFAQLFFILERSIYLMISEIKLKENKEQEHNFYKISKQEPLIYLKS